MNRRVVRAGIKRPADSPGGRAVPPPQPQPQPPLRVNFIRLDVLSLNAVLESYRTPDPKMGEDGRFSNIVVPEKRNAENESFGMFLWRLVKSIIRRAFGEAAGDKVLLFLGAVAHYGSYHVSYPRQMFCFYAKEIKLLKLCGMMHARTETNPITSLYEVVDRLPGGWLMNVVSDENLSEQPEHLVKVVNYLEASYNENGQYSPEVKAKRGAARDYIFSIYRILMCGEIYYTQRYLLPELNTADLQGIKIKTEARLNEFTLVTKHKENFFT